MSDQSDYAENTFRILVSTDNHLGFAEKDGIRGQDSFRTFEEILNLARVKQVDFVFFAGDIFHDSRPSQRTMHETIRLLRTYCLGDKPVQFELLADPKSVFSNTAFLRANYLDPNLNVAIPVFTIHGNHDDPNGPGGLCAADLLHAAGLVNLIGKTASVERIDIRPLLLRKGSTYLAIYGLGAMREERVHRLFANNMVTFYRPTEQADQWFSVCAVHQNRVRHGATNYLPEQFLPNFLDLVIWGHEHECRVEAEWNATQNFFVIQPGSSVATALSEGEARDKAVALLEIRGKEFKVTRIPLRTVRPLIFEDVALEDELPKANPNALDLAKQVETTCIRLVEQCIRRAADKMKDALASGVTGSSSSPLCVPVEEGEDKKCDSVEDVLIPPAEPLIRLRLDLSGGFEAFSMLRFGQRFIGRVANPKDLITFNHNREQHAAAQARRALKSGQTESQPDTDLLPPSDSKKVGLDAVEVENLVRQYLCGGITKLYALDPAQLPSMLGAPHGLELFTAPELGRGLRRFVDHDSRDAIQMLVDAILGRTVTHLRTRKSPEDRIVPDIQSFSHARSTRGDSEEELDDVDRPEVEIATVIKENNPAGIVRARKLDSSKPANKAILSNSNDEELEKEDDVQGAIHWSSDEDQASQGPSESGRLPLGRMQRSRRTKISFGYAGDEEAVVDSQTGATDEDAMAEAIESDDSPPPKHRARHVSPSPLPVPSAPKGRGRGTARSRGTGRARGSRGSQK